MSSHQRGMPAPSRSRARRSLAQIPQASESADTDKENITENVGAISDHKREPQRSSAADKKMRSKSLGPGGLDALKNATGNRRQSTATGPLKSILKRSVPLSPPRHIPSFEESRKKTPTRRSPRKSAARRASNPAGESDLIDFSTPTSAPVVGSSNLANPFDAFDPLSDHRNNRTGQQTEDERREEERVERERRETEKQAILQQREARRKSMANRRVSFAPEATLHTWNVVELAEDTSSSASNSTRRESSFADPNHEYHGPDAQKSPYAQGEKQGQPSSPARTVNNDEAFSSSPFSGSSVTGSDDMAGAELLSVNDDAAFSDSDDGESTAMSMENMTGRSISPSHSDGSTTDSSGRLDQSLRQAAAAAGTSGIDYDENGDISTEFTNHEIAGAFKPWVKKDRLSFGAEDLSSRLDQENVNPFTVSRSPQQKSHQIASHNNMGGPLSERQEELSLDYHRNNGMDRRGSAGDASTFGGQTMEFTNVVGGIAKNTSPSKDFSNESEIAEDEDMTMEFTSAFGGVIAKDNSPVHDCNPYNDAPYQREGYGREALYSLYSDTGEGDGESEVEMDITGAVGGILPPIEEHTEPLEYETMGMDMTHPVGKILTPVRPTGRANGGMVFEEPEPNQPESSPFQEEVMPSPVKPEVNRHVAPVASENGSPGLANIKLNPRRSTGSRKSTTPTKPSSRPSSPPKTPTTPPRRESPRKTGPRTPGTTPPSRKSTSRSASPRKSGKPLSSQSNTKQSPGPLFRHDNETGQSTPSFVLRPPVRSPSGLGVDKEGLGSPRVAEILDRRRSIGDDAQDFVPRGQTSRGVRFEDPRHLEKEIDDLKRSHQEEGSNSQDPDKEPTLNLREMISSLTPNKSKSKGRKSLHVGSAKGVLGKRPVELDDGDEDEDDDDHTPKRLKGRQPSPVKNVKLPAPPSKAQTVGKMPRLSLRNTAELSPQKNISTTPKGPHPHKYLHVPDHVPENASEPKEEEDATVESKPDDDIAGLENGKFKPIQLSEFLEMTNIHFMELTTTKRRHTLAPDLNERRVSDSTPEGTTKGIGLEDCVAAGFCTIPMLELYQHSCRELKSYISEGRRIIRSIETETCADNPPLFQEYVTAPPDIRLLMDNQFRNVKTHARLLSKSMWYEWRMKLLEGLKQGLDRHAEEMQADDMVLSKKEKYLDSVVPKLVEKRAKLEGDAQNLERVAVEMESCDREELRSARGKLSAVDAEIAAKKKQLQEMQALLQDKNHIVESGTEAKTQLTQQISEAERVREECRGWSVKEVQALKSSVLSIEQRTGWSVLSVSSDRGSKYGPTVAMRYRSELRLDFNPGAFSARRPNTARHSSKNNSDIPLTLSYSPESSRHAKLGHKVTPSAEKALMMHAMRTRFSQLSQESTHPKVFLADVSKTWDTARALQNEIRLLNFCGVTRCKTAGIEQGEPALLKVRCILLGPVAPMNKEMKAHDVTHNENKLQSRIDIEFTVKPRSLGSATPIPSAEIDIDIDVSVRKVYGFGDGANDSPQVSEERMRGSLNKMIQPKEDSGRIRTQFGNGLWRDAVKDLKKKIIYR